MARASSGSSSSSTRCPFGKSSARRDVDPRWPANPRNQFIVYCRKIELTLIGYPYIIIEARGRRRLELSSAALNSFHAGVCGWFSSMTVLPKADKEKVFLHTTHKSTMGTAGINVQFIEGSCITLSNWSPRHLWIMEMTQSSALRFPLLLFLGFFRSLSCEQSSSSAVLDVQHRTNP